MSQIFTEESLTSLKEFYASLEDKKLRGTPVQNQITHDSYMVIFDVQNPNGMTFGWCPPPELLLRHMVESLGVSPAAAQGELRTYFEWFPLGFRLALTASQDDPDPVMEMIHITSAWPITYEEWREAMESGWEIARGMFVKVLQEVEDETQVSEQARHNATLAGDGS